MQQRANALGGYWAFAVLGITLSAFASAASPEPIVTAPTVQIERVQVPGGADLFTYFRTSDGDSNSRLPFLSVLRDSFGDSDPSNDRLRQVWAFSYSKPSIWRRMAAMAPFFYRRIGGTKASATKEPSPVLDLGAPTEGTWTKLAGNLIQSRVLDPLGAPFRMTMRSYALRAGDHRMMHVWEAVDVLAAEPPQDRVAAFTPEEFELIQGRLLLSGNVLGGLVKDSYASTAWRKERTRRAEMRGHNWELLRQRAEDNGLYFQPLRLASHDDSFAMLWVKRPVEGQPAQRSYDPKFIRIPNPFTDARIRDWKGYTESRPDERGQAEMIPLGLYGLDHPRVPLLLVDFRDAGKPRRREMMLRLTDDVATGVLGWTGVASWPYLVGKNAWMFVHGRRGGAVDRKARLRAYVQLRHSLVVDESLDPQLRREMTRRLEQLGLNPLENGIADESTIVQRQYAALMGAVDSGKLTRELSRARRREAVRYAHSQGVRASFRLLALASLGLYRHREADTPETRALVDQHRRFAWHKRFLEQALVRGPVPQSGPQREAIDRSLRALGDISVACGHCDASSLMARFPLTEPARVADSAPAVEVKTTGDGTQ